MQFRSLAIKGFKSFVEPTELAIQDGLTGIVGPNGCGKSNLVEALRWVMGENSAKRMRGDDMDDVIFAGTDRRPARNMAEVALAIDNTRRTAPAPYESADDLEIARRIERGKGSEYRVNGKVVRQRDVQILFADAASGANSPALVSQGRVSDIINAKPTDRRMILEEAAGVAGLHARRHEAELRLRAAENNLTRVDDLIGQMQTQMQALQKQARQASRYRNLSGHIRNGEAQIAHVRWVRAEEHVSSVRARVEAVEASVQELTAAALAAATTQAEKASRLPTLRQAENEAGGIVQKLILERESLERDRQRLNEEIAAARGRLEQSKTDLAHEQSVLDETRKLLDGIEKESEALRAAQEGENDAIDEAGRRANQLRVTVEDAERAALQAAERVAADEARRTSLERQAQSLHQRAQQLKSALEAAQNRRGALQTQLPDLVRMAQAETAVKDAETALDQAKQRLTASEETRRAGEASLQDSVEAQRDADSALAKLKAEASALSDLLKSGGAGKGTPVLDAIRVEPGYERALAAAIGDALNASADITSPIHWRDTPPASSQAPSGTAPLAAKVEAPAVLSRALSLVGLAPSRAAAEQAAANLQPGQTVVSPEGAAYRWDGLTVTGEVKSQTAVRLEQRNRLAQVETLLVDANARAAELGESRRAAQAALDSARSEEREARRAVDQSFETLNTKRREHLRLQEDSARLNAQIESLNEQVAKAGADLMLAETDLSHAQGALGQLPDPASARAELAQLRQTLATERQNHEAANQHLAALQREAASRRGRLAALAADRNTMSQRADRTSVRIGELETRAAGAQHALAAVEEKPKSVEETLQHVLSHLTEAEALRREAADALSEGEKAQSEADRAVKQAEAAVSAAKEQRAALNAEALAAEQEKLRLTEDIRERLQVAPSDLFELAEFKEGQPLPPLEQLQGKLERLIRERDTMGPVNLRADAEMQELSAKIEEIEKEKNDLIEAIARLRAGISKLNGEAKERLLASFSIVDGHFQTLFKRLFGGGHAHLSLTDPDNPLESGLEIYASPPGKKLQAMTLLSGGEKALTALALIFGMFLTNPSPICVLDEVDAPLDDSNVDRFCDMLHEMAKTGTRFLVVTHHQLTMARMDRLFGVTMTERGVSQLVSVDLTQADLMAAE